MPPTPFIPRNSLRLEVGAEFQVPIRAPAIAFRSEHAAANPLTPLILPLEQNSKTTYGLSTHRGEKGRWLGLHLFVPDDLKAGETLIIQWVEGQSACAIRKSDLLRQQAAASAAQQPPNCT